MLREEILHTTSRTGTTIFYFVPNVTPDLAPSLVDPSYMVFDNLANCVLFVNTKYRNAFMNRIVNVNDAASFTEGFVKGYIEAFPNVKPDSQKFYEDYVNTNSVTAQNLYNNVAKSFLISQSIGL